jgi:cysteine desulfurase
MQRIIYADNAATTRMSEKAYEAMVKYLTIDYANASQSYSFARYAKKTLKEARETIATCIGAEPDEIYFTSCGTESDNWVIKCTLANKIITSQIEHHAILNSCISEERKGRQIVYLPVTETGIVLPESLNKELVENSLVSIMFSNNEIGTLEPIKELAYITHQHDSLFHTDAVQAIGHINLNVKDLDIDFLSASAHKFNGPKGIGFLYIKKSIELAPFIYGGSQEMAHRAGTENIASIVAMAIALKENVDCLEANYKHISNLEIRLIYLLTKSGIKFKQNGDSNHIPGNISLSFPGFSGEALLHRLDFYGIYISTGSACNSKKIQISHVLRAIKLEEKFAKGTIRISLGKENTDDDINIIANAIIKIVKQ